MTSQTQHPATTDRVGDRPDGTGPALRSPYAGSAGLVQNSTIAARMTSRQTGEFRIGYDTWETRLTGVYAHAIAQDDLTRLRADLIELIGVAADWLNAIDSRAES